MKTSEEILKALAEMKDEIGQTKDDAENFKGALDDVSPEELPYDEGTEGPEEGPEALSDEEKEKAKEIKTPEDAKKALNEAKKDISDVIEHLDGLLGQTEGEEKTASVKRFNERYASSLTSIATEVDRTVADAKQAMSHWTYLLKMKAPKVSSIKDPALKQAAQQVQDVAKLKNILQKVFKESSKDVTSTAVPPTRSDYTGDKWPDKGNPAEVENRAWAAGASEFDKDKKREDARPNPSVDDRLVDEGNPHDEKPFVNAALVRFVPVPNNKFASYWDIYDGKTRKRIVASFAELPVETAPTKNDEMFTLFSSRRYGNAIKANVMGKGIGKVQKELNAKEAPVTGAFLKTAAEDKGTLKSYYTDAYGSSEYAAELTSGGSKEDMEIGYNPKDEHPKDKKEETKDGPGKISKRISKLEKKIKKVNAKLQYFQKTASTITDVDGKLLTEKLQERLAKMTSKVNKLNDKLSKKYPNYVSKKKAPKKPKKSAEEVAILKAKADKAILVARKFASRGAIPFTQAAIYAKGEELMTLSDDQFKFAEQTVDSLPIYNVAALKEAHIPETEKGIIGNKSEGVSDPKAQVKTEDIDPSVKSDARIAKQASAFVPQMQNEGLPGAKDLTKSFNTTSNRLAALGINAKKLRLPTYKQL